MFFPITYELFTNCTFYIMKLDGQSVRNIVDQDNSFGLISLKQFVVQEQFDDDGVECWSWLQEVDVLSLKGL